MCDGGDFGARSSTGKTIPLAVILTLLSSGRVAVWGTVLAQLGISNAPPLAHSNSDRATNGGRNIRQGGQRTGPRDRPAGRRALT